MNNAVRLDIMLRRKSADGTGSDLHTRSAPVHI